VRRRLLALVLLVVVAGAGLPGVASAQEEDDVEPGRMLVYSVPGLTWEEVAAHDLPALEAFFASAGLADLAPRGVSARSGPGDAYLTISAGARATTERTVDGQVLALDEQSSGSAAGEIFRRRTGLVPDGDHVALGWPELVRRNDRQPYDAVLGLLAETLQAHDVGAAAIGNADGTDSVGASYERQVGLALADTDGVVASGAIGKDLLVRDPAAPFGTRLEPDVVVERFRDAWSGAEPGDDQTGGVVVVEASDLGRVLRYRSMVDSSRYETLRSEALRGADDLFERLMAGVDLEHDTVMVVAPYNRVGDRDLTAIALHRPGDGPGYLTSASTQRAGFLTLVDVAPTILVTFDIERPVEMEGRPAELVRSDTGLSARVDHLVSLNEASRFRERLLVPTTVVVVVILTLIAGAAAIAVAGGRTARWGPWIGPVALFDLAILPASYLARGFPLEDLGIGFYWAFTLAVAAVIATVATVAGRSKGRPRLGLVVVLAIVALVLVGDVMTGSRLSLSAAFGYSPTGNSRLYGISNYSYGQLASAACLLAAFVAAARPDGRGRAAAMALLVATLIVLGVPIWGSDVGGVLAFTPTILVFAALVLRRRIRLRTVALGVAATAAAITAFGFLDLARPPEERAHLGRLFERVGDEGLGPLFSIMERKLLANLQVSTSSMWVAAIPVAVAFWVFLARFPTRPVRSLRARIPTLGAGLVAALVAAVLGSLVNDSGAIVGGVAAMVVTASLVHLTMEPGSAPDAGRAA
jgi:hypothetical protein